jgi:hypothetical protein
VNDHNNQYLKIHFIYLLYMKYITIYNKPINIVLQIYYIIEHNDKYNDAKKEIEKFLNNLAYWSPELIEIRFWKCLYKICIKYFNNTDEVSSKVFNIYTQNIKKYSFYKSFDIMSQSQIKLNKSIDKVNIIRKELEKFTL